MQLHTLPIELFDPMPAIILWTSAGQRKRRPDTGLVQTRPVNCKGADHDIDVSLSSDSESESSDASVEELERETDVEL